MADAAVRVYHSEGDDGNPSTTPVAVAPGTTRPLHLWIETTGQPSSASSMRCETGDGAEICALLLRLRATGIVTLVGFTPEPGLDLLHGLTGAELSLHHLDPIDPTIGRRRLGTLQVSAGAASCASTCVVEVGEARATGAALQNVDVDLATASSTWVAVPEPEVFASLTTGALGLAGLAMRRRNRNARSRRSAHGFDRPTSCDVRPTHAVPAYALLSILIGFFLAAERADAQVAYRHDGATAPSAENWGITPGDNGANEVVVGAVAPDPIDGGEAWSVADVGSSSGSRLRYEVALTPAQVSDSDVRGWFLRVVLRVVEPAGAATDAADVSVITEVSEGAGDRRYAMFFGTDPAGDGDPVIGVFGGAGSVLSGPWTFTLEGAGDGYHEYVMSVDPATGEAAIWVDGIRRITRYVGIDAGAVAARVNWGSGASATTGTGHYRTVEWGINEDRDEDGIPDPADNCPSLPNPDQLDSGAAGSGGQPDGIGDVCQCGDLDGDGSAGQFDLARLRAALLLPQGAALDAEQQTRCGVLGDPFRCDLAETVALARAQTGLGPGIAQSCIAAQEFEPSCGDGVCSAGVESCRSCASDCGKCLIGEACGGPDQCASGSCPAGTCAAVTPIPGTPRCGDGICEGNETCSRVGLFGCYDDCGPCSSATYEHCNENSDCDGPQQCVLQGRCSESGTFCAVDDSSDDCPEGEYCDVTDFGVVVFGGLCSDFETQCLTAPFGIPQQDACDPGDVCRRRSVCNPPQAGACGAPPVYVDRCPNGEECIGNDDCESGVCYQMYVPVASEFLSFCSPPMPDGFPCTESNDCQGFCNVGFCMSDLLPNGTPCTINAACESGICNAFCVASPLPNGTPCFSSSVCASGLCLNGVCSTNGCGDSVCNEPFESCATPDPGAPFGQRCQADCGQCENGHACVFDSDCASGSCDPFILGCRPCRYANDGTCANGETCNDDVDCSSGNCVGEEIELVGACAPVPNACSGSDRPNGCGCTASSQCSSNRCVGYGGSNWCVQSGCTAPGNSCDTSGECCDFPGNNLGCYDQNPVPILTSYRCALEEA